MEWASIIDDELLRVQEHAAASHALQARRNSGSRRERRESAAEPPPACLPLNGGEDPTACLHR